ncbi:hypothetical protein C0995_015899 [Termitomyces sp. Mi166|nr:hypothetical protein C0995_015899 [Termitomyces sp. Mi166\
MPTAMSTPSPPLPLSSPLHRRTRTKANTRTYEELVRLYDVGEGMHGKAEVLAGMSDEEVVLLVQKGKVAAYALEKVLSRGSGRRMRRAVRVQRKASSRASRTKMLEHSLMPFDHYDYTHVLAARTSFLIPMAMAKDTLVASTSCRCKAVNAGVGVKTLLIVHYFLTIPDKNPSEHRPICQVKGVAENDDHVTLTDVALLKKTENDYRILRAKMIGRDVIVKFTYEEEDAIPRLEQDEVAIPRP